MMVETFIEFTFEAAHKLPPFAELHGHSFKVALYLQGTPDPVYGWSHNLYDVEKAIAEVREQVDHKYLNDLVQVPSLENVARWIWEKLDARLPGVDRIVLSRGREGSAEGCTCSRPRAPAAALAA